MKKMNYWAFTDSKLKISRLSAFVIILNFNWVTAQSPSYSVQVVDQLSKEPVPYVHMVVLKKNLGLVSDANGVFTFSQLDDQDSIKISHVAYKPLVTTIGAIKDESVIELVSDEQVLDQVVVTAISDPKVVLEKVVSQFRSTRRTSPHIAKAYYAEQVKRSDELIFIAESIGYSVFCGDSSNWSSLARQNFYCDRTRLGYKNEWMNTGQKNTKPPMGNYVPMNYLMVVENYGILSPDHWQDHKVAFDDSYEGDGYALLFSGEGEKGLLLVNDHFQLKEIRFFRTNDLWSSVFNKRCSGTVTIRYAYFDEVPVAHSISLTYSKRGFFHRIKYENLAQKLDEFKVTHQQIGALQRYARNPLIRSNGTSGAFWRYPDAVWEKVERRREGKSYMENEAYSESAFSMIEELKRFF